MNPILSVQDLHVRFPSRNGSVHAVSGASFEMNQGEILGIVGESGCGKSAMAKALTRLLPSGATIEGKVLLQGIDLVPCKEETLQSIRGKEVGFIFQDPMTSLNPTMKVGEQITEGYLKHHPHESHQKAFQHALSLLETVGIAYPEQRFFEYPHTLSGGMRQKITIALALAAEPKILIADEPTTALDPVVQSQILSFLASLQKTKNTTIILITHDLSVVAGFCDRVMVMYAGKVVECAPVEDLFYNPKHPYTQKLLKAIPRLDLPSDESLIPIHGSPPVLNTDLAGCSFFPRCCKAIPICKTKAPPLYQLKDHSYSRCWLSEKESL